MVVMPLSLSLRYPSMVLESHGQRSMRSSSLRFSSLLFFEPPCLNERKLPDDLADGVVGGDARHTGQLLNQFFRAIAAELINSFDSGGTQGCDYPRLEPEVDELV